MEVSQTTSDYQSFLKLMTAQMRHQDPLAPLDATQFVTQLAQFSQVEQLVQANGQLGDLQKAIASLSAQGGVALIGRDVEVQGDQLRLRDGEASYRIDVDGEPAQLAYMIEDASGRPVRSGTLDYSGPQSRITWDGRDDAGSQLEDGRYRIAVRAVNAENEMLPTKVFVTETVSQVLQQDGKTTLRLENGETIEATADMTVS